MSEPPGEFELIERIRERLRATGAGSSPRLVVASGDDAAVSRVEGATATSVDLAIEGVHFDLATTTPREAGHKALAAALSDLAAMGAEPGEAYVGLGVRDGLGEAELLELAEGMAELAASAGMAVAGGDVSRAAELVLAVTVVGHAGSSDDLVTRSGASAGEAVVVSGALGAASGGLELLRRPELAERLEPAAAEAMLRAQREPRPRLELGRALAAAGATAMIDLSDGLVADAGHLAAASGVTVELDARRIPLADGVAELAGLIGADPLGLALAGGEDYELLACLPAEGLEALLARLPAPGAVALGRTLSGPARVRLEAGELPKAGGYDQLRHR